MRILDPSGADRHCGGGRKGEDVAAERDDCQPERTIGQRVGALVAGLLIVAAAGGLLWLIFSTEPEAERVGASKKTAMLVEVTAVERGDFRPRIEAMGVVRPARDIVLRPRVAGEVLRVAERFAPGSLVDRGALLLQLDPADYRAALARRQAELRQAEAALRIEMGHQSAARQTYQMMDERLPEANEALVLREPQLASLQAEREAARVALEQARRELGRTRIAAPFDAQVIERRVDLGSQVGPGDELGRLVGRRSYWVETSVPLAELRWLEFPAAAEQGAPVRIRERAAWPEGVFRQGRLYRLVGALADQTRMARVLVTVDDPLALEPERAGQPPLLIDTFVHVSIQGRRLDDVVRLELDQLRKNDTAWVMRDGALDIRSLQVVFRGARYAYVRDGLDAGERVVTTNLATVVQGAPLRLRPAAERTGGSEPDGSHAPD
jgi:RND family efflux transporter MFP subunit